MRAWPTLLIDLTNIQVFKKLWAKRNIYVKEIYVYNIDSHYLLKTSRK